MTVYNGDLSVEDKVHRIECGGYRLEFACTYNGGCPKDLDVTTNGWEMRRRIKDWALNNDYKDIKIFRNTGYLHDLHGEAVYELYVKIGE